MVEERSFWKYLILSIITCGIYSIIFWYQYSIDMNTVCNGDGKETRNYIIVILLSFITCGIYYYVWMYGVGNRLQESGERYGLNIQENGTTLLLWTIIGSFACGIGPLVAMYFMIKDMNEVAVRYNAGVR